MNNQRLKIKDIYYEVAAYMLREGQTSNTDIRVNMNDAVDYWRKEGYKVRDYSQDQAIKSIKKILHTGRKLENSYLRTWYYAGH